MHPPVLASDRHRRPFAIVVLSLAALLTAGLAPGSVSPVAANEPTEAPGRDVRSDPSEGSPPHVHGDRAVREGPSPPRRDEPSQPRTNHEPSPPWQDPYPAIGYDISYPQCGGPYPESFAFAIVGVNGGRVYSANPCLGADGDHPSQLEWAGPDVELYVNTGNPGPRLSAYWPIGQQQPRECATGFLPFSDTHECAYVYGWNAAAYSYRTALEAFISVGWLDDGATRLPTDITWWLDVEAANSWRMDRSLNAATLQGSVAYLESMGFEEIGFYSTPRLWNRIVGGTEIFDDYPAWHGGARNLEDAARRCASEPAFTGGELRMVQWIEDGFDANIRCR